VGGAVLQNSITVAVFITMCYDQSARPSRKCRWRNSGGGRGAVLRIDTSPACTAIINNYQSARRSRMAFKEFRCFKWGVWVIYISLSHTVLCNIL
jgi:hypothetical protein